MSGVNRLKKGHVNRPDHINGSSKKSLECLRTSENASSVTLYYSLTISRDHQLYYSPASQASEPQLFHHGMLVPFPTIWYREFRASSSQVSNSTALSFSPSLEYAISSICILAIVSKYSQMNSLQLSNPSSPSRHSSTAYSSSA